MILVFVNQLLTINQACGFLIDNNCESLEYSSKDYNNCFLLFIKDEIQSTVTFLCHKEIVSLTNIWQVSHWQSIVVTKEWSQ